MKAEIILSTIVAASTAIYTAISLLLWWESRETRRQKLSPLIIPYLEMTEDHSVMRLCIKNVGEGLAHNVKIRILKDYERFSRTDSPLSNIGIVQNGLNTFPPQYKLSFYMDLITKIFESNQDGFIELEVEYESIFNKKYNNTFSLQFNQIFGQNYSTPPESFMGQIPHYLKEINYSIKKISNRT